MLETNGTILAVIINFLILVWVLKAFLYKPVEDIIRQRKGQIESDMRGAKKELDEARQTKALYETKMKDSRAEAGEIIKNASEFAAKIKNDAFEASKTDAEVLLKRAASDAQGIKDEAIKSAKADLAQLVTLAAEKLIKKTIDQKDREASIEEAINIIEKASLN
ncbi:MAG: F0F1 ATP synthase subunit B [Candidatus Margulisiibacteriota bacterium]